MFEKRDFSERTYRKEDEYDGILLGKATDILVVGFHVKATAPIEGLEGLKVVETGIGVDNGVHAFNGAFNGYSSVAALPAGLDKSNFRPVDAYCRRDKKYYHYFLIYADVSKEYLGWDIPAGIEAIFQTIFNTNIGIVDGWINDKTNNLFLKGAEKMVMLNFWGLKSDVQNTRKIFFIVDDKLKKKEVER